MYLTFIFAVRPKPLRYWYPLDRKHDRYSDSHHHERNSGNRSDRQGSRVTGQPETDVRSHRQGAAGRSDRIDPRA